jgi:hypothetical protein
LLTKTWKTKLRITIVAVAGFLAMILVILSNSEPCKIAVAAAQSNAVVRQRLGGPVRAGFLVTGEIDLFHKSGRANLEIPIRGPRGKAILDATEKKMGNRGYPRHI